MVKIASQLIKLESALRFVSGVRAQIEMKIVAISNDKRCLVAVICI